MLPLSLSAIAVSTGDEIAGNQGGYLESNWKLERAPRMKQYLNKGGHADGVFGHSDLGAIEPFWKQRDEALISRC